MLPQKVKIGTAIGLLLLCSSGYFASATTVFQQGPLTCYTCDSLEECALGKGLLRKCEDELLVQTCMTVFDESGVVEKRGCSDGVSDSFGAYCAANPGNCPKCSSIGCNEATSLDEFVDCLACDSSINPNCVINPSEVITKDMCMGECMTALYPVGDAKIKHHLVRSCLRDKDLDDRVKCLSGDDPQCNACLGANCNVAKLPDVRSNCYHCNVEDDNCDDPEPHECIALEDNDECFIQFNSADNDIISMGCRSEFDSESEIIDLIKEKVLWFCAGDNCNGYENSAQNFPINSCAQCNSGSNEICATNANIVDRGSCPLPPYTQCYERAVTDNGATLRGCLKDLMTEDFYACLTGTDPNCRICHGNGCNVQNIPTERVQCLRCDSTIDSTCHARPSGLSACPKYDDNDSCVSNYVNGVTKRGCQSEFACDVNSKSCQICKGNGCNALNVKKRTEEIYGIFQTLPLNCNTCTGEECQDGFSHLHKCEGSLYQDCISIFNEEGIVVRRGCEDLIEANYLTHCEEHPELCFNCKSNGCNTVLDYSVSKECLYCDSAVDANCIFNPAAVTNKRRCTQGCITSLYPRKGNEQVFDLARACLEDLEFDDRDGCTTSNCKQCNAADGCNTDILPENTQRLACNHCSGDDCDVPVSRQCVGYAENDQCYIQFDNVTYSAVAMGCKSEFTESKILAEAKQFYICDGENCNDYANLDPAHICIVCDSATDVKCAIESTEVTTQARCQINPYTSCYTRVRSDGHTERGCLYNLPIDSFLDCRDSKDPNCYVCSEKNCNQEIFPVDRQQCYRCNSTYWTDCEATPSFAQACPIYKEEDSCITKIDNGVTHRGCSSELSCEDAGRKKCRTCRDKNCNTINLIDEDIGDPGLFQTLPLNCYDCEGSDDCKIRKCEGNNKQTCTTAFASNGSIVSRGCSDLLEDVCSNEDNNCYDCKSSGCNTATSESDFVDCVFCDAQESDTCTFEVASITRSRKCHKSCMTALYPRTADVNPVLELTRTCLDDMDLDDRAECAAGNSANCLVCNGANCNTVDLGEHKSCYQCSGDECQSASPKVCRAFMEHEQCYVQYDEVGEIVELGCKSQYDPPDVDILLRAKRLWLCDEDNCNIFENIPVAHACTICNSRTDTLCATSPNSVAQSTVCSQIPFTQCYMRVLDGGYTERGCLSSLNGDQFINCLNNVNATECRTCDAADCNKEIHPADRLSCNTCSSDTNAACETTPQSSQVCLKYIADQQCASELTQSGITKRGCSSEVTCDPNSTDCVLCEGINCNTSNLKRKTDGKPGQWQELPLTCHSCSDEQDCAVSSNTQVCQEHEYCMVVFGDDDTVISRGCSDEVESIHGDHCDLDSAKCFNCNSNQCNSAKQLEDYVDCIYCDGKTNNDCVLNVDAVLSRRKCHKACMTALYPRDENSTIWELTRTCLDDKDIPDQLSCSGDLCKSCEGAACNVETLPEDRRSCWSCNGVDCEDPNTSVCQSYKENDRCFLLFDDVSDIARMGCESDLDESYLEDNIHMLLLCDDGDNCNFFDKIPSPQSCAACNSVDDPTCAASPNGVPTVAQCSVLPNTQCYTKVNRDGSTARGCVSSLPKTELLACLSGDLAECTTCLGDRCNIDIFPADRRICHRCNTKEDPLCESSSVSTTACPVYTADDFCTVKYVNGGTYRGCGSEFQCDDSDKRYCRQCFDADNCNFADLASLDIGTPGKWQDLPINCHTCVGENCQDDSYGPVVECADNNMQTCGVVFANNGSVIQRGCSDQIFNGDHIQQCDDGHCRFCKSSICNIATSLDDFVDCIHCDSTESSNCVIDVTGVRKTRSCHGKCMVALYPRSGDDTNPILDLSRSCLDDLDQDDRLNCENGDKNYCKSCQGDSCNIDSVPEFRSRCYVCEDEAECATSWVQSQTCVGFRENDQCFTLFDEDKIQRMGCASSLETPYIQANRRQLFLCDGDNCNNLNNHPTPTSCNYCNSTTDANCLSGESVSLSVVCEYLPYSDCFTRINDAGITVRGCLNDLPDNIFNDCLSGNSNTCAICRTNNCNQEIYPAGRLSCNRCNSLVDTNCETNAEQYSAICPIYEDKNSCVTAVDGSKVLRGCASEFTCDTNNRDRCRYCETDNCNTIDLLGAFIGEPGKWQELPLNCYHCEAEDCATGNGQLKKCEGNNQQTCTTVFAADDSVSSRGCSDVVSTNHADYCEENSDKCIGCKSNGCNNAASLDQYENCYFCDSTDSKTCSVNFDTSTRTRKCHSGCMVALYPRTSSADPAYEMSRSCLDDMDLDDRSDCKDGAMEYCIACEGDRCNTVDLPDEERHECYSCIGDDCEDAEVRTCSAYHPNDQCYTLYDFEGSIAGMGCRSEFETEVATDLVKQKLIRLCDDKNCNGFAAVPMPNVCSTCNSDIDPRCATNPILVANTTRCADLPYPECYSHVNSDGHTLRGCLSSLDMETFYSCLTNPDDKRCEICTGDKCNEIDVFPSDRLRCHQCSSSSDATCGESPNSNTVCPIYDEADTCVTNLRNGVTTRGCSSSLKCDNADDRRSCRVCTGSGCNTIDLTKVSNDGEPGRWQGLPINCYTCDDEEDCQEVYRLRPCENNIYQNCMAVFNAEGKVIQRGCSDKLETAHGEYCENNAGSCPRCNSNGCNVAYSLEQYVECLSCDTDKDGNCLHDASAITNTRRCFQHCMTALYVREEENNPAYGLTRSCWDDMDPRDREDCQSGNKEYCEVCNSGKCNTVAIPEERLSCYHCQDDDCQDPQAQTCVNYRPGDKCYIQYDEKSSIIAMGCRSEYTNSDADYLLKEKRLFTCDQNDCNTFAALPTPTACALCNSRTDVKCAVQPQLMGYTTCAALPITQCYSRVLSDGLTERGCLSNLQDDEFLSCLNGTSSTCEMCDSALCNRQIFPSDRRSCHICDSSVNANCEAQPNSLSICPKYDAEDVCVTQFRNDVTYRGCSSSLSCDENNPRLCQKCTDDGCNKINLARRQDDNFGKWQDLPLSCWTCEGEACQSAETTESVKCANNNEQDCVVVFDASGSVIRRGCSDEVESEHSEYCDISEENCYNCKSNECNSASSRTDFVDCVYCDSYKDLNCIWDPENSTRRTRKCAGGCMTVLYPSDSNINPSYELIRTCLNDKEAANQTICAGGLDSNCTSCTGTRCNVIDFPEDRLSCYYCKGESCDDPAPLHCPLYKQDDKCFIWVDEQNSVSEMGCISSFRNQELESILKTKRVLVCDGKNCNSFDKLTPPQRCALCDSNDNVACATDALEVGTFNTCSQMPYTSCYSKLANDGSTVRGCLYDLPADDFVACLLGDGENCGTCEGDGCNREIFPADRLQCFACTTADDSTCESFPSRHRPCPKVVDSESCISAYGNNVTVRGCSSQVFCDSTDRETCRQCKGTSCNTIDLRNKVEDDGYHGIWQSLPLRCHKCEGDHCKNSLGPYVTCDEGYEEDCITVFEANGDVRRRGCYYDVETYEDQYCRQNPERCQKCKSNECNVAWSLDEYVSCAFCNSSTNASCVTNPEYADFAKRSCYKECMVALKEDEVVRSCLDDKELLVQHVCRTDETGKECATCEGENCNQFNYPVDRKKCHICAGSSCTTSVAEYCEKYDENDYCFAKYENGLVDIIGCASSQNASDIAQWIAQKKFFSCEGNECNELTKLPSSGECLSCDSSKTPQCAQNPAQVTTTEICSAPRSECLTRIDLAGFTWRGCANTLSDEQEDSCIGAGTCAFCSDSKCNSEKFPANRRECYICNSVADKGCDAAGLNPLICPIYMSNDSCVAYKDADGVVIRGCRTDRTCDESQDDCTVCSTNLCNTVDLTLAAGFVTSSLTLTLILAFVAIFTINN